LLYFGKNIPELYAILREIEKDAYRIKPVAPIKVFEIIDMNIFE